MTFHSIDVEMASRAELIAHIDHLEARLGAYGDDGYDARAARLTTAFGIPPSVARLLDCLRDGRPHSKESILSYIYSGRVDDEPEIKIIDVHVCKLRKAVWRFGIQIATLYGFGFRLDTGQDVIEAALDGSAPAVVRGGEWSKKSAQERSAVVRRHQPTDVLIYLRGKQQRAPDGGLLPFRVSSNKTAHAVGLRRPTGGIIRELERRGFIEVIEAAKQGAGVWLLRLTEEGMAQ